MPYGKFPKIQILQNPQVPYDLFFDPFILPRIQKVDEQGFREHTCHLDCRTHASRTKKVENVPHRLDLNISKTSQTTRTHFEKL